MSGTRADEFAGFSAPHSVPPVPPFWLPAPLTGSRAVFRSHTLRATDCVAARLYVRHAPMHNVKTAGESRRNGEPRNHGTALGSCDYSITELDALEDMSSTSWVLLAWKPERSDHVRFHGAAKLQCARGACRRPGQTTF